MLLNVIQIWLLTHVYYLNRIKTNITHTQGDRMVSSVEHPCVGYYDAISKKKARAHVNERNVLNYIMCPAVNAYQKSQRLINLHVFVLTFQPVQGVRNGEIIGGL